MSTDMTAVEGWNIQLQHRIAEAVKLIEETLATAPVLPEMLRMKLAGFVDSGGAVAALTEAEVAAFFEEEQVQKSSYETELKFRQKLASWSDLTFGDIEARGPVGPLSHLKLEAEEAIKKYEAGDFNGFEVEMADCQMIWWDALRRARITDPDLLVVCHEKFAIVQQRNYPRMHSSEGIIEHIRPMVLHCPKCNLQHVDKLEPSGIDWRTRPHRKHQCASCGHVWMPYDFYTVGVEEVKDGFSGS